MLQSNLTIAGEVFNLRALISVMAAVPLPCRFCPDYSCLTLSFLVKHYQTELLKTIKISIRPACGLIGFVVLFLNFKTVSRRKKQRLHILPFDGQTLKAFNLM